MYFDAIIGVSMRATSSENSTAMVAVKAKGLKNWPGMPSMKATGTNTAHSVNVVATTARPISMAASLAACKGGLPMRRWRTMFHLDDGIVHQHAHHQRQRQHGQRVHRKAE